MSSDAYHPFRDDDADEVLVAGEGIGLDLGEPFGKDGLVPVDVVIVGGEHRMCVCVHTNMAIISEYIKQ